VKLPATVLWLLTAAFSPGQTPAGDAGAPDILAAAPTDRVVRTWQTDAGLPQNSVNAVVQTRDGFLWVGTNAGLARFDGVQFQRFGLQDGLRSVTVMALAEDREGALWIGTSGGGLSRWQHGRITTFGAAEGFPAGVDVLSLAADRDGSLWIGTEEGLLHRSGGAFQNIGAAEGLPRNQVRVILQDAAGKLWVSVMLEGLYRGTGGRFTRVEGPGPVDGNVYCLVQDRAGVIWAGVDAGRLWCWRDGIWTRFKQEHGLPAGNIESLAPGGDGTLWIGARNGGVYHGRGGQFYAAAGDARLSTLTVRSLTVDREGSVWAGTVNGGLRRLSRRVLEFWNEDAGLPPGAVTSVAEDGDGVLWAATNGAGLFRWRDGRFLKGPDATGAGRMQYLYSTVSDADGGVWAAGEQWLYHLMRGQPVRVFGDAPVKGEAIRALCTDGAVLWAGTYYSALLKCEGGVVRVAAPGGTFPGGITSMALEAPGVLWVGTSEGLHRWAHGKVQTWTARDGLLSENIRVLHRDGDGTLWIGSNGGGLARMKDGTFVHITMRQGLIDDVISQIVPDDFQNLWLGCNRGIMRIERSELEAVAAGTASEVHPMVFDRNEGLLHEQCSGGYSPAGLKSKDGRLFFPTAGGIAVINPRRLQHLTTVRPEAGIVSVRLDQQTHGPDEPLVIPAGPHRLELAYTAPVLRGGEWVRFRHRLEGLDRKWIPAGVNRHVSYDGLPPGDYVFRVAAADGRGNWNEPGANFAFRVQPFIWQTWWFRAAAVLFLAGFSGAAAWWHLRRKHRRQLAELERERRQQSVLAHASRLSTVGQLTATLAHELNQPLTSILSNAQAAQRMTGKEPPDMSELQEILKDIVDDDRRAVEVIQRLRALLKRGETRMDPLSLNDLTGEVLRLSRSDLNGREITVRTTLADGLPDITGDPVQLQQVVLNLIVNACDAMAALPPEERILRITTSRQANTVRLSVQDQGCGLPDGDGATVFQPFFTTKTQGMGIGLSICRTIVAGHRGSLRAEPNDGPGAVFHLELPAAGPAFTEHHP
jgi:signal transduction histidine kinase/ligand-binding sensor domain-containing protein